MRFRLLLTCGLCGRHATLLASGDPCADCGDVHLRLGEDSAVPSWYNSHRLPGLRVLARVG